MARYGKLDEQCVFTKQCKLEEKLLVLWWLDLNYTQRISGLYRGKKTDKIGISEAI